MYGGGGATECYFSEPFVMLQSNSQKPLNTYRTQIRENTKIKISGPPLEVDFIPETIKILYSQFCGNVQCTKYTESLAWFVFIKVAMAKVKAHFLYIW